MTPARIFVSALLSIAIVGCGEPTVIDIVKDSHVSECKGATVGDMLVGYFPTTNWTAYNGDAPGTFRIHGEGELQVVGATRTAVLRFVLDESTGSVTFDGATLGGAEQTPAMAGQILAAMCEEATG
jgi:hypothetical protein